LTKNEALCGHYTWRLESSDIDRRQLHCWTLFSDS